MGKTTYQQSTEDFDPRNIVVKWVFTDGTAEDFPGTRLDITANDTRIYDGYRFKETSTKNVLLRLGDYCVKANDAERWGGVLPGSIYHALKKLEQEQYIEISSVEQTGHRQKAVYKITEQGKDYLQSIILDSLRVSSVLYPTTLYAGLSFMSKISLESAREALKAHKKLLDEEYKSLEKGKKSNEDANIDVSLLSKLTIENMFAIVRQQQQYVDNILHALAGAEE